MRSSNSTWYDASHRYYLVWGRVLLKFPIETVRSKNETPEVEAGVWSALGPVADALSKMPDEHVNYVLKMCLGKCHRLDEHSQTWARVTTPNGDLLYQDIDVSIMMQLVFSIIQENLESFFNAPLPLNSAEGMGSRLN